MCVAVPLKVVELIEGAFGDVAVVEAGGVRRTVALDIVDRRPQPGEYVLVHAGFAIHTLSSDAGRETLALFAEMAREIPASSK